jgi:ABC-type lipoprotein release transport system permease subunit
MASLLFEVSPADPRTYIVVTVLLIVVALVAAYVPARRAARVDPMLTLRSE